LNIIYKILAVYTLGLTTFFIFLTLPILETSNVSYRWNDWRYILSIWHFIPLIIFAGWSIIKKESKKV